jgi:hypothetical protein
MNRLALSIRPLVDTAQGTPAFDKYDNNSEAPAGASRE